MKTPSVQTLACCAGLVLLTAGNPVRGTAQPVSDSQRIEHQAYERLFQQNLARVRAAEAVVRSRMYEEVVVLEPAPKYHRMIAFARDLAGNGRFQWATQMFNGAMAVKPVNVPLTADVEQLGATLASQSRPVEVAFRSDGMTFVTVVGVKMLRAFADTAAMLRPGDYEVVGRRKGYQDVRLQLRVRQGEPPRELTIVCTERAPAAP